MNIELLGIGCALPPGSLTQADAAHAASTLRRVDESATADRQTQLLSVLYRRSGVQRRHSVLLRAGDTDAVDRQTFYEIASHSEDRGPTTAARMQRYEIEAPLIAEQACRSALSAAGCTADDVRHLVTVSCSGFNAPGFDLALYPRLGLSPETSRSHVGFMGCHGALNGMRVANSLACQHPGSAVLLCAVELCTLHHQYTDDPQQIVANSLFADGAAAAVIRATGESSPSMSTSNSSSKNNGTSDIHGNGHSNGSAHPSVAARWSLIDHGSYLLPDSSDAMSWRIGDHGFNMTLSAQVPELIKSQLRPWLENWLARNSLQVKDIATWAVHPGGPRILSAAASALDLDNHALEHSLSVLADCGNMSSPTILFILKRLQEQRATGPCVALAFGPGLVVESLLLV